MFKRIKTLIDQHTYSQKKKIGIITDKTDEILDYIKKEYGAQKLKLTDDFDPYCLVIIKNKDINGLIIEFINKQIKKLKKFILIVKRDFDFSNLVKTCNANSVDAIILKDEDEYIIVITNN
jgi:hypothetical protein